MIYPPDLFWAKKLADLQILFEWEVKSEDSMGIEKGHDTQKQNLMNNCFSQFCKGKLHHSKTKHIFCKFIQMLLNYNQTK